MRLIFDEMLKRLASWSRILGIYSEYFEGEDAKLVEHAKNKNLIVITRDLALSERCEKHNVKYLLIKSDKLEEQLVELLKETKAEVRFPEETRCASCNGELEIIEKEEAKGKIPEDIYEKHDELWKCKDCEKIFWRGGSHWRNINRIYEKVKKSLESKTI